MDICIYPSFRLNAETLPIKCVHFDECSFHNYRHLEIARVIKCHRRACMLTAGRQQFGNNEWLPQWFLFYQTLTAPRAPWVMSKNFLPSFLSSLRLIPTETAQQPQKQSGQLRASAVADGRTERRTDTVLDHWTAQPSVFFLAAGQTDGRTLEFEMGSSRALACRTAFVLVLLSSASTGRYFYSLLFVVRFLEMFYFCLVADGRAPFLLVRAAVSASALLHSGVRCWNY